LRDSLQAQIAARSFFAYQGSAAAQPIGQPVGRHAQPAAFINVMNGGENGRCRNEDLEKPGHDVGVKAVAMHQVGVELQQKPPPLHQAGQQAGRIPLHLQAADIKAGRPLLCQFWPEDQQGNGMTASGHTPRQCQHLPFRSAHAQRIEHIDNPHFAQTLPGDRVER